MTYMHQGRQFVVVGVRGPTGSGAQLMAFWRCRARSLPAEAAAAVDVAVDQPDGVAERRRRTKRLPTPHGPTPQTVSVCGNGSWRLGS